MRVFAQAISLVCQPLRCPLRQDLVVHSWPNLGWTIGSIMRCRPDSKAEKPCKCGRSEAFVAARHGA
jgi:hypothetical protein